MICLELTMIKSSSTTKSCMTPLRSHVLSISNRNNRDAHLDYLRHLKESVETIRDIVEEAKVVRLRDRSIVSACRYTKHSQELLEYAIGTCPQSSQQRAKQLAYIPLIRKKQVTIAKPSDKSDSTTHRHVVIVKSQKNNVPVPPSTRVNSCLNASGSQTKSLFDVGSSRISIFTVITYKHLLLSDIEDSVMDPVTHKFNFPSHSREACVFPITKMESKSGVSLSGVGGLFPILSL
nr:hypothetical protein [Tanacetum cinerariifolium]